MSDFLNDRGVAVAPLLTAFAAPLVRAEPSQLRVDADARSRGLTSVARTFRPDALWAGVHEGPERSAFEAAMAEGDGADADDRADAAFERDLTVHGETVGNLGATPGCPPLIASVDGPGELRAGDPDRGKVDQRWLELALGWGLGAIQAYAAAGVAAIAICEGDAWSADGGDPEDDWHQGIDHLRRVIKSFGIAAWLWCDRAVELGLGEGFDLVIVSERSKAEGVQADFGLALDPEALASEAADAGDFVAQPRLLTTGAQIPVNWGVERARRAVAEMRSLAGSWS